MNVDEAKTLLKGPFGKVLLEAPRSYVSPLYWGTPKENGEWTVDNNGTAFAIDCGAGPFLVTASHVYEGYLEAKAKAPAIRCQLGNMEFIPEKRVIDFRPSAQLDIATFQVTEAEIRTLGKTVLKGSNSSWPPDPAAENAGVLFAGFPGIERKPLDPREYVFGVYAALTPVSSVSHRHFGCAFERHEWIDIWGRGIPEDGYDLGGISGAPMLVLGESRAGVFSWRLGGVLYNASAAIGEIVLAHHARYIRPDGSLDESA